MLPGQSVEAAGVFGMQDNQLLVGGAAIIGSDVAQDLGADTGVQAVAAAGAVHAAREANAAAHGLSVAMLVVVCPDRIHLFEWDHQQGAGRGLAVFDRATTTITVTKFGASRRLTLRDNSSGVSCPLTGSVGVLSTYRKGAKAVLAALPALPAPG